MHCFCQQQLFKMASGAHQVSAHACEEAAVFRSARNTVPAADLEELVERCFTLEDGVLCE